MELAQDDAQFFDWDSQQMAQIAQHQISGAVEKLDTKLVALADKLERLAKRFETCEDNCIAYQSDQQDLKILLTNLETQFDDYAMKKKRLMLSWKTGCPSAKVMH